MTDNEKTDRQEQHRAFAAECFNLVWGLLDKEDRTAEDDERMVHATHASRFHWGEIGGPVEFARGEWQISRVYAVLGRAEAAVRHGQRSLDQCQANGIGDFDLAFAYEGLARGYAVAGDAGNRDKYLKLARQASEQIEEEGNKEYFLSELDTVG